ncbi:MAG: CAP domain-containing protein [Candidatus Staskawiczbacteria bacterium]|nr:CAP domain-containing protein [Candidatus Staskawiczbacteria bacterium]
MNYSLEEEIVERFFEKIKSLIVPSENNNYKSRFLQSNALLYVVVLLLVLRIFAVLISTNIPQNIFFADITKSTLENFVNQTRQSMGLGILTENEKLNQAAQLKAQNMVQDQYFNHTSPNGVTPWFWFLKAGYSYHYAGENLAIGFYDSQEVYNAWLNSPSHKANITNPNYTEVGTAVLNGFGGGNTIVVVQEFASPSAVKTVAVKTKNTKQATINQESKSSAISTSVPVTTNNNERVLSQSVEAQNSLEAPTNTSVSNLPSKLINTVLYNYDGLLKEITYGVSLVVIGIMFVLIFFNFNFDLKEPLVIRAALVISLLAVTTLLNKEMIISLIPHQIFI